MDRFRLEGSRLEGYMIVDTRSGRRIGKKSGYGQPYKVLGAARKRMWALEDRYREATPAPPRQPYGQPLGTAGFRHTPVVPKPATVVLPDELFQFE